MMTALAAMALITMGVGVALLWLIYKRVDMMTDLMWTAVQLLEAVTHQLRGG